MLVENIDYYINEDGNFVFTEAAHRKRGYCCKSRCLHCPWHYGRDEQSVTVAAKRNQQTDLPD